jgi:alpha-tubulin suppressor-like RCC1 family protein
MQVRRGGARAVVIPVVAVAVLLGACEVSDLTPTETASVTCSPTENAVWGFQGLSNEAIAVRCGARADSQRVHTCYEGAVSALQVSTSEVQVRCSERATVAAGGIHTCALVRGGAAKCWGDNSDGQLGNLELAPHFDDELLRWVYPSSDTPVPVTGISGATAIAAGFSHSCALRGEGGTIKCWGLNTDGQLGNGTTTGESCELPESGFCGVATPVAVGGITGAVAVDAGGNHADGFTCALLASGSVKCWGNNSFGRLGDGLLNANTWAPVSVVGVTDATAISVGLRHACAVVTGGAVKCWGYNGSGQLGNGTTANSSTPVAVTGLTGAVAVSAGSGHTCALLADRSASCWGSGASGQLGDSTTASSAIPVAVTALDELTAITASFGRTCGVQASGQLSCWGMQPGGGSGTTATPVPGISAREVTMALTTRTIEPPVDVDHSCAWIIPSAVYCWGANYFGQLGNGTTTDSTTPVAVTGL